MDFGRIFAVAAEIKRRKSTDGASPRSAGVSPARRASPPRVGPSVSAAASASSSSAGHDLTMALKFKRTLPSRSETPELPSAGGGAGGSGFGGSAGGGGPGEDDSHQYDHHFRKKFPHCQSRYWPRGGPGGGPGAGGGHSVTLPTMAPLPSFGSQLGVEMPHASRADAKTRDETLAWFIFVWWLRYSVYPNHLRALLSVSTVKRLTEIVYRN